MKVERAEEKTSVVENKLWVQKKNRGEDGGLRRLHRQHRMKVRNVLFAAVVFFPRECVRLGR